MCLGQLLRSAHLLRADGLLRTIRLLHAGELLHFGGLLPSVRLLHPSAAGRQLSKRNGDSTHDRCDLVAPEF